MKADVTLDCIGLNCPMPIVKTSQKMKELEPGQVLEVSADDEGIKEDMPAWCIQLATSFWALKRKVIS